jgi:hypothetical protein
LVYAIQQGVLEGALALLEHPETSVAPGTSNVPGTGDTVLTLLCGHNRLGRSRMEMAGQLLLALLARSGDPELEVRQRNKRGATALHYAAALGRQGWCESLLRQGATLDAQDVDGESALHYAAREGQNKIVTFLVGQGANVQLRGKFGTPLDLVYRRREERKTMKQSQFQVSQLQYGTRLSAGFAATS